MADHEGIPETSSAQNRAGVSPDSDEAPPTDSAQAAPTPDVSTPRPSSLVDGHEHQVDPQTVKVGRTIGFLVALPVSLVPLALLTLGWALDGIPGTVYLGFLTAWSLLLGLVLIFAYNWPAARYRHLFYRVETDSLQIRRGVLWRKVVRVPITRVQHTDVSQGPVQRRYDLATLTIHTAGTASASIPLAGLKHATALQLSGHLQPTQGTHES